MSRNPIEPTGGPSQAAPSDDFSLDSELAEANTNSSLQGGTTAPTGAQRSTSPRTITVAGYEIERVLGRGGMGIVYKAQHRLLKRIVALKMVITGEHAGPHELARFRIEAEAVARLQHPNIVQIHDVGEAEGHPYFALEFVEGGNLAQRLNGNAKPPREAAILVETLARAMQVAHSRNIVHRDLKPANILLTSEGIPKITDFGLARQLDNESGQTQTGMVMGTPSYMAPEQASGYAHEAGPAADVYALGAILYDCLAGRPPFKGKSVVETLDQVRTQDPLPPSRFRPGVPVDLETICLKCLRKEQENRYASASELADELSRYLRGEPIRARHVGPVEQIWRWCKRHRLVASMMATTAVALVVGTVVSTSMAFIAHRRANTIDLINRDLDQANKEKTKAALEAIEQARIADEQSQLAYKTLESVIFDIQTKLAAVPNAQQVRGDLLKTALSGMQNLSEKLRSDKRVDRSTAVATLNLAEVFRQVSNDTGTESQASANQLYQRAVDTFEALYAASPNDQVAIDDLAEACVLYSINLSRTDDLGANTTVEMVEAQKDRPLLVLSGAMGKRAIELRRKQWLSKPEDPKSGYQLSRALAEWAYQEMRSGSGEAAREALAESHGLLKSLLDRFPEEPSYRFLLGRTASRLGDYYYDLVEKAHEQAAPFYEESLAVLKKLALEKPKDHEVQMEFANAWSRMGDLYAARGNYEEALDAFWKELEVTQSLEKLAPNNLQTMADSGISYDHVSRELLRLKRYPEALPVLLRVTEIRSNLVVADPLNRRHHAQILRSTKRLGKVYEELGQPERALEVYRQGLDILTSFQSRTGDRSLADHIQDLEQSIAKLQKSAK